MKVIIAGSREFTCDLMTHIVDHAVRKSKFDINEVVSGTAKGVDTAGETWAFFKNIKITKFPADWKKHGKAAGPIRNGLMAEYADALIAIWDGQSSGTKHMIESMKKIGKPIYVLILKEYSL